MKHGGFVDRDEPKRFLAIDENRRGIVFKKQAVMPLGIPQRLFGPLAVRCVCEKSTRGR